MVIVITNFKSAHKKTRSTQENESTQEHDDKPKQSHDKPTKREREAHDTHKKIFPFVGVVTALVLSSQLCFLRHQLSHLQRWHVLDSDIDESLHPPISAPVEIKVHDEQPTKRKPITKCRRRESHEGRINIYYKPAKNASRESS